VMAREICGDNNDFLPVNGVCYRPSAADNLLSWSPSLWLSFSGS
jgi:hypothetical protein